MSAPNLRSDAFPTASAATPAATALPTPKLPAIQTDGLAAGYAAGQLGSDHAPRMPAQANMSNQHAQFTGTLGLNSPFTSPIASSSSYSGFTTTPSSEVSTSSMSSFADDERPPNRFQLEPLGLAPACTPYQGFYADNEPSWGSPVYANRDMPMASAPIRGHADGKVTSYFEMSSQERELTPLQSAALRFDRLFGNWRIFVDSGRAEDSMAAALRLQVDSAYTEMMDMARARESYLRDGRKRGNSITSTPNPSPIKVRRESNAKLPPLLHTHTSPVLPMAGTVASSMPPFVSKAISSIPATQATVDGVHFGTPLAQASPIVVPSPAQHTPHTPSPLSAAIVAPVLQHAETPLNVALASGLPSTMSAPSSPHLRSELAQAFYEGNAGDTSNMMTRQPLNPRASGVRSRGASESLPSPMLPVTTHRASFSWAPSATAESYDEDLTPAGSPRDEDTNDDDDDMAVDVPTPRNGIPMPHPPRSRGPTVNESLPVSAETKATLDKLFMEFLNSVCRDPEYTDHKGEMLHQALLASKMDKLVEAGDYRPFKMRIQAFTNAFNAMLLRSGINESEVSVKVVRQYLWQHPLISRFNDEGKKSKSRGNHIWTVEAKKIDDETWQFREFPRRLVLPNPRAVIAGHEWSWVPRIWDPRGCVIIPRVQIEPMPSWLSWLPAKKPNKMADELKGIVPREARGSIIEIEAVATYEEEGAVQTLRGSFSIIVSSVGDEKPARSRASSFKEQPIAVTPTNSTSAGTPDSAELPVLSPSALSTTAQQQQTPTLTPNAPDQLGSTEMTSGIPHPNQMPGIITYSPQQAINLSQTLAPALSAATLTQPPMQGLEASALTAVAVTQPSLGVWLSPMNLLKEEMSLVEQRPGPIETAVIRHAVAQETLAAGPSQEVTRQALDDLSHAQQQVSQAVSEAQERKLDELLPAPVLPHAMPFQPDGVVPPPPTPAAGLRAGEDPSITSQMFQLGSFAT